MRIASSAVYNRLMLFVLVRRGCGRLGWVTRGAAPSPSVVPHPCAALKLLAALHAVLELGLDRAPCLTAPAQLLPAPQREIDGIFPAHAGGGRACQAG